MKRLTVLAVAAVTAVALAACGTTEDPSESRSESGGDPITVTDARGKEVTLDGPAVNVAATEWNAVEYLISLGVQPVGVSDIEGFETWDDAVELADTATDIGTRGEPNMDILSTLDLDAVFVTGQIVEGAVEQIEDRDIPVIVLPGGDSGDPIGSMWSNIDLIAQATGTETSAADLKSDFETMLADAAAVIAESDVAGASVAFNDAYNAGEGVSVRPFTSGSLIGGVLAELGFANAWDDIGIEGDAVYGLGQTDVEGLTKLPDDVLYWYIGNEAEGDVYTDALADNAIWTSLPFVASGNVARLPDSIWMFGGPASMTQFVAAVLKTTG